MKKIPIAWLPVFIERLKLHHVHKEINSVLSNIGMRGNILCKWTNELKHICCDSSSYFYDGPEWCVCCCRSVFAAWFFFLQTFLTSLLCVFIWMIRGIYLFLFSSLCLKSWTIPCEADTLGNWREVPADDDGVAQTLWLCLCPWYSLSSSQSLSLYLIISPLCGSENISVVISGKVQGQTHKLMFYKLYDLKAKS